MAKRISFKRFLLKIDRTPEYALRDIMGKTYINTPGAYKAERKYYSSIFDYYRQNMGIKDFKKLRRWYIKNPNKVKQIMRIK